MEHSATQEHSHPAAEGPEQFVALTPKAVEMVKDTIKRDGLGDDYGLRVGVVGGGCSGFQYSLTFDNVVKPGDEVIERDGVRLFVDEMSAQYLKGITIDYVSGLHGAGFKFLNPNATRTCGCGSSFAV